MTSWEVARGQFRIKTAIFGKIKRVEEFTMENKNVS